ncbi:MAG TPA: hypothetical protein ENI34_06065 [candidate division WOR-3 bacterium]|uniref:DUF3800 domain-containing protein n=1 Tax=candidate division WOR-3 bacterium TaxID=2052148 RepID=A0A9C9EMX9_UNCW3|nr:hypothetical protein [candidate division WOR-3 bacterium]
MKFLFIDEVTIPQKERNFLGVGAILIDTKNYIKFKESFQKAFSELKWTSKIEFKGRYIFSKKGDSSVPVEKRITFIYKIAKSSKAKKNARYTFYFAYNFKGKIKDNYILLLKSIGRNLPKPSSRKGDKRLIALYMDKRNDVKENELFLEINEIFKQRDYFLFEKPFLVDSTNLTPGIIIVDVLSYLMSWKVLSSDDFLLFHYQIPNTYKRKLEEVRRILDLIKNVRQI